MHEAGAWPEEAHEMALFGQQPRKDDPPPKPEPRVEPPIERTPLSTPAPAPAPVRRVEETPMATPMATTNPKPSESILAAGLTVEGKIEGNGNFRVAGRFKGNINVKGELTIEPGASIDGEVRAETVFVGGEVRGHIVCTSRVEFKESGTLIGDIKAGSLTVAAGSKMRGKVEFGWKEGEVDALPGAEAKPGASH
jgi:cytoskeletal protein CcmA (bactofilin family)